VALYSDAAGDRARLASADIPKALRIELIYQDEAALCVPRLLGGERHGNTIAGHPS
jgi:hypothetical protein